MSQLRPQMKCSSEMILTIRGHNYLELKIFIGKDKKRFPIFYATVLAEAIKPINVGPLKSTAHTNLTSGHEP